MAKTTYTARSISEPGDPSVTLIVFGVLGHELGRDDMPADPFAPEAVRGTRWLAQRTGCPVGEIRRELWRAWLRREAA